MALGLNFYAVAAEEEDISVPKVKLAMWVCISFRIYFILILLYNKDKDGKEKRMRDRSWYR